MHATLTPPVPTSQPTTEVDNRSTYVSFASAYVLGHGAAALSKGTNPVLTMPGWLPMALLGAGLAVGTVQAVKAANRAQRGAGQPELLSARLLGASWITGFAALFLAITGLTSVFGTPGLQEVLWPAGSTLMVGLLYLAEGAARRNSLHYALGTWLTLLAGATFFFSGPGFYTLLAVAGGGAYAAAAILERRRLTPQPTW